MHLDESGDRFRSWTSSILSKFIISNADFIIFNAKFIIFNAKFKQQTMCQHQSPSIIISNFSGLCSCDHFVAGLLMIINTLNGGLPGILVIIMLLLLQELTVSSNANPPGMSRSTKSFPVWMTCSEPDSSDLLQNSSFWITKFIMFHAKFITLNTVIIFNTTFTILHAKIIFDTKFIMCNTKSIILNANPSLFAQNPSFLMQNPSIFTPSVILIPHWRRHLPTFIIFNAQFLVVNTKFLVVKCTIPRFQYKIPRF